MGICYIVGAGELYGEIKPKVGDFVIAADGGLDSLYRLGITPDVFLGDMDSACTSFSGETIRFPVRKDETDAFLAYREGANRGYTDFILLGGTGGREDHTFANISLLYYAKVRGHRMKMIGRCNVFFVIRNEKVSLSGKAGTHFSAFALGCVAHGVTLSGLEYEAENITLSPEYPLAASNLFTDSIATVEVKDGALLIMTESDCDFQKISFTH